MSITAPYIRYEALSPIIGKPFCGWSSFDMYPFHGSLSYVDDIPNIILNAILEYHEKKTCIMSFDEEGSDFHVIIKQYVTFIIHETDNAKLYAYNINAEELLKQFADDIGSNIDAWAEFNIFYNENEPEYQTEYCQNKKELLEKLQKIKNLKNPSAK